MEIYEMNVKNALSALKQGKMIVLIDDKNRENEGDIVLAAEHATPKNINFIVKEARGLVCLAVSGDQIDQLDLPMMVKDNQSSHGTAFTVSIEAAEGVSTGISAYDRALTIQKAIAENAKPADLVSPGHIFPLRAEEGGVLKRQGHTEASVDLMRLAGLRPGAVICEIMDDDGTMARLPQLTAFAEKYHLPLLHIHELIRYRQKHELFIEQLATASLPTQRYGDFEVQSFRDSLTGQEHVVLIKHTDNIEQPPLVRVHSSCITGDIFTSQRCDCGQQLRQALSMIQEQGGALIYMHQEGRGIGLANKIKAYALQEEGFDTVEANHQLGFPADLRDYTVAAQILKKLGMHRIKLLTNNPKKLTGLSELGIEIDERLPIEFPPSSVNQNYMQTKKEKLGHMLDLLQAV